jgi:putative tryptophan/tyrosine transport system substrate-binding protein
MRRRRVHHAARRRSCLAPRGARSSRPCRWLGFLSSRSSSESAVDVAGFRRGLAQLGFIEGQNVSIEYRWADNRYDRLPALASDLVRRQVAVIAALGGPVTALAVKEATTTIPFVFISGVDPVKLGLVVSFARPGGNATGLNIFITAVEAKRLGLLNELLPGAGRIGVIVNPNSPELDSQLTDLDTAARASGRKLDIVRAGNEGEIDAALRLSRQPARKRSWSPLIRSSTAAASTSSAWPRGTRCQRFMKHAVMPSPAG